MKCPNCSFMNPDNSVMCKVCGYEFNTAPSPSSTYPPDKTDSSEESQIEVTFDTLFGVPSNSRKMKSPFEKSKDKKHLLNNLRQKSGSESAPESPSLFEDIPDTTVYEDPTKASVDSPEFVEPISEPETSEPVVTEPVIPESAVFEPDVPESIISDAHVPDAHVPETIVSENNIPESKVSAAPIHEEINESMFTETTFDPIISQPTIEPVILKPIVEPELPKSAFEPKSIPEPEETLDVIDVELVKNGEIKNEFYKPEEDQIVQKEKTSNKKMMYGLLILILILILIFFALYNLNNKPTETTPTATTPVETTDSTDTTGTPIVVDSTVASSPQMAVQFFFDQLPEYINNGNISFLMYFSEPQVALEQLTVIKSIGLIDSLEYVITAEVPVGTIDSSIQTITLTNRTIEGKVISTEDKWLFTLVAKNDQWYIQSFDANEGQGMTGTYPPADTSPSTEASTETSTSTDTGTGTGTGTNTNTNSSTTTTTTTTAPPEGFVKSGTFTGGIITDGQDLGNIRYGNHNSFERLVLDLYQWQLTSADGKQQTVPEPCHYEASISSNGLEITIILSGARAASAKGIAFGVNSNIKSLDVFYPQDDSSIGLKLTLKKASSYKVFSLKEPGRIVVDVMAN